MKSQTLPKAIIPRLLLFYILGLSLRHYIVSDYFYWPYVSFGLLFVSFFILHVLSPPIKGILICSLCFLFGFERTTYLNNSLPPIPENGYVVQIIEPPISKQNSYKSIAKVILQKVDSTNWENVNYTLLVYFTKKDTLIPQLGATYLINNIPVHIEKPKNPNQFDYQAYLKSKAIFYQQFLQTGQVLPVAISPTFNIKLFFKKYAHSIGNIFQENLDNQAAAAVVQAMVTGIRDDIDKELAQVYSNTGAVHILAVSGMHVGIIYMISTYILNIVFSLISHKWRKGKVIIILLVLISFACFTGLSPSVVRATTMFIIVQCASLFHRSSSSKAALFSTALLLLVISPGWLVDLGFQLSFLAVYGILTINPLWSNLWNPQNPIIKSLWDITAVGFSAQLITFPLSLFYFHQFPTYFFLANPIVSVCATFVIVLALAVILFASLPFTWVTSLLSFLLSQLVTFLNEVNIWIAHLPWSVSENHQIDFLECAMLYGCIVLFVRFFYEPTFNLLKMAISTFCFFCIYNIYDDIIKSKQEMARIHPLSKSAGISIIQGKFAVFISNSQIINDKATYDFTLKNYFITQGIRKFEMVTIQDSTNAVVKVKLNGKSIKLNWIANPRYIYSTGDVDVCMISNNSRVICPTHTKIILDGSNKAYFVKRIEKGAQTNGTSIINLTQTGSIRWD
ncbi:MAG: ComEC/Rec2 family competence protein [Spirosomataceae bacterium]